MSTEKYIKKKVFISYKANDNRSKEILGQLEAFFNKWGLECKAVEKIEGITVPSELIHKELGASDYLIQLLNQEESPSLWMKKEWKVAGTLVQTRHMFMRTAFYRTGTPITNEYYKEYYDAYCNGTEKIINIDEKYDHAKAIIHAILIHAGVLGEIHGEIVLPDFCSPPRDPAEISLKSFEDFIDNFRHAYSKGLSSVYPDVYKPTAWLVEKLNNIKGEIIRMMGFTLNRYVYSENRKGTGELFEKAIAKNDCKAKLLIIDRDGESAHERMKIETPSEYDTNVKEALLYKDNKNVEEYYTQPRWKDKVSIKKYQTPYVGMVIFNDMILVELYHLGNDGEKKIEKNICGRVPVLFIRAGTPFYRLFESHFEQVWKIAKDVK